MDDDEFKGYFTACNTLRDIITTCDEMDADLKASLLEDKTVKAFRTTTTYGEIVEAILNITKPTIAKVYLTTSSLGFTLWKSSNTITIPEAIITEFESISKKHLGITTRITYFDSRHDGYNTRRDSQLYISFLDK